MKIILSCRAYPTQRPGGMPFVCQDRARALVEAGHEVHVFTTGGEQGAEVFSDEGVSVHHLPCESQKYTRQFAEESLAKAQAIVPDILHFDGFDVNHLWWVDKPWKVGITLHGFGPGAFLTKWNIYSHDPTTPPPDFNAAGMLKEITALRKADRVIAISRHEQWMMEDFYNLYGKVHLVYNPIPSYFFDLATAPDPKSNHFVCLGNPGTSGNRRFDLARETGADVRVIRGVPRTELPAIYAACKAVLIPTFWSQGFDLTVAEALASRRPVIATATGSYYREGRYFNSGYSTGYQGGHPNPWVKLVPRGDVMALARAMKEPMNLVQPECAAGHHRPEIHAERWMEAMGC